MELTNNSINEDNSRYSDSTCVTPSNPPKSPKPEICISTTTSVIATSTPTTHKKILSKNGNGTVVATNSPNNDAELQLYRIMQKASLLSYYDTLIEMGGDDVQQLCDAGEEEFLEIMALVGMASKPLHVRRFQKSLQEWMIDPSSFQVPLVSDSAKNSPTHFSSSFSISHNAVNTTHRVCTTKRSILETSRPTYSPSPGDNDTSCGALPSLDSPALSISKSSSRSNSPFDMPSCSSSSGSGILTAQQTQSLLESQINKIQGAAERIAKNLPKFEPKIHNTKKKVCKELETVMAMSEDDPHRMEEIRKYAAIYGRFDCKRKPEKVLTLHEVSVNEAAAQICHFIPALLTRRDELFPLARQIVRDLGYHISRGPIPYKNGSEKDK